MPPMTKANSNSVAQMSFIAASFSVQGAALARRQEARPDQPIAVIVTMYMATARMPGTTPAMNSLPTSCSVISP